MEDAVQNPSISASFEWAGRMRKRPVVAGVPGYPGQALLRL